MSYNNIFNPLTNEFVEVNTSEGLNVLKNYVSYVQNGGSKKTNPKSYKSKSKTNADNINKIIKEAEKKEKDRKEKQAEEARKIATVRLRERQEELKKTNPQLSHKEIKTKLVELWPKLYYEEYNKLQEEYEHSLQRMPAGFSYYDDDKEESDPDQQGLREEGAYGPGGDLYKGSTNDSDS
jgi:hypothetical protein